MGFERCRDTHCHGCTDRYTACYDHCKKPEFLKWKEEQETIRRNRAKGKGIDEYTVNAIRRSRKRCR